MAAEGTSQDVVGSNNVDKSSLSNPKEVTLTHLDWEATVDFESHCIRAIATYTVVVVEDDDDKKHDLKLDTRGLTIDKVSVNEKSGIVFTLADSIPSKPHLGRQLSIPLSNDTTNTDTGTNTNTTDSTKAASKTEEEKKKNSIKFEVRIEYTTSSNADECTAIQWLQPSQTAGKVRPYLFTQCQAIHARSILPCMDCPAVKMTYRAKVTVPSWSTAVMSALSQTTNDQQQNNNNNSNINSKTFEFHQPIPIPSYLFALAVGQLQSQDLSSRVRIWSEPSVLSAAAFEFQQTEHFLQIAERITDFPYPWQRYDLLCLPPSFPYGGMENPCLTFLTPTLLAGDLSLADVVAHEISHSWTGNLVTNATWSHFWLNEGWTMWLQRQIMATIHSHPNNNSNNNNSNSNDSDIEHQKSLIIDFDALGGWKSLQDSVNILPPPFTRLVPNLDDGEDPDEAFSSVPYEKGYFLLRALEDLVGKKPFLSFARTYFKHYQRSIITSEQFRQFFHSYFQDHHDHSTAIFQSIQSFDWDTWLYGQGMPPGGMPNLDRSLSKEAETLAHQWIQYNDPSSVVVQPPIGSNIESWQSNQKVCFLDTLLSHNNDDNKNKNNNENSPPPPLSLSTVQLLKVSYGFHETNNSEIFFRFSMLAIMAGDKTMYESIILFLTKQGRMKFIRPLYRAMANSNNDDDDMARKLAIKTFCNHKSEYHPIATKMISMDLEMAEKKKKKENERNVSTMTAASAMLWIPAVSIVAYGVVAIWLKSIKRR